MNRPNPEIEKKIIETFDRRKGRVNLNEYTVRKMISWGGYSVVYGIYRDSSNEYDYVLRVSKENSSEDLNNRERDIWTQLNNESQSHIVRYLDHFYVNDKFENCRRYCYLMKRLIPLNELKGFDYTEIAVRLGNDLLPLLQVFYEKHIIHRDIKPENIFYDKDFKNKEGFMLGDYGIARLTPDFGSINPYYSDSITQSRGTRLTAAPELFHSNNDDQIKDYSRVDQYSLGIVMYYFLNEGEYPPNLARIDNEKNDNSPFLEPKFGTQRLKALVLKATEYNPENRFKSPNEMLEELLKCEDYSRIFFSENRKSENNTNINNYVSDYERYYEEELSELTDNLHKKNVSMYSNNELPCFLPNQAINWTMFSNVFRMKAYEKLYDYSEVKVIRKVEDDCSERISCYLVEIKKNNSQSKTIATMKCICCHNYQHACEVNQYYFQIGSVSKEIGFLDKIFEQKLVISHDDHLHNKYFLLVFFDYYEGQRLSDIIESNKQNYNQLSLFIRCDIVYKIAYAVKKLNDSGVYHCNLTQDNVYLSGNISEDTVNKYTLRIRGFGIPSNVEDSYCDRQSLKKILLFSLTGSSIWDNKNLLRLPCESKFRKYLYEICCPNEAVDLNSSFDENNNISDNGTYRLYYDSISNCLRIGQYRLDSAGFTRSGIYLNIKNITTGASRPYCDIYEFHPLNTVLDSVGFYVEDNNVFIYPINSSTKKLFLIHSNNEKELLIGDTRLFEGDIIEFPRKSLFEKKNQFMVLELRIS